MGLAHYVEFNSLYGNWRAATIAQISVGLLSCMAAQVFFLVQIAVLSIMPKECPCKLRSVLGNITLQIMHVSFHVIKLPIALSGACIQPIPYTWWSRQIKCSPTPLLLDNDSMSKLLWVFSKGNISLRLAASKCIQLNL